jgi:hypothetical protein
MISVGEVTQPVPSKRAYLVSFYNGTEQLCQTGNFGIEVTYDVGDQVVCVTPTSGVRQGPIILCRINPPAIPNKDKENLGKSVLQLLAEEEENLIANAVQGYQPDGIPDWGRVEDRNPLSIGDIQTRSRTSEAFSQITPDGSIINFVNELLHLVLASRKSAAILRMKELFMDVIPGFRLNVGEVSDPEIQKPDAPKRIEDKKVRLESFLASDPEEPNTLDFGALLGALNPNDDPKFGQSQATRGKRFKRGGRIRLGDLGVFEVDLDQNEIRFTLSRSDAPGLYQIRLNKEEAVFSWGSQFVSFRDEGLLIKADMIGLAGPWGMWSPETVAGFTHDVQPDEQTFQPIAEWKTSAGESGIKFSRSVYFGSKEEPAILEGYIDTFLKPQLELLGAHTHNVTAVGAPTGPMLPPITVLNSLIQEPTVDTYLSLVKIAL